MTAASLFPDAAVGAIVDVVIGTTSISDTAAFLALFDFAEVDRVEVPEDVARVRFGLDSVDGPAVRFANAQRTALAGTAVASTALARPTLASTALASPGGSILAVPTPHLRPARVGWEHGPRAVDIYTTDLDASLERAVAAGFEVSPVGGLSAGPMSMRQAMVHGPDSLSVVLVDTTHRRSSVLDELPASDPDGTSAASPTTGPFHSEVHSVVWVVAQLEAERERWVDAGWTAGMVINFSEESISAELGLADRPTPITMTMLSDDAVSPIRLELMAFDERQSEGACDAEPVDAITTGIWALGLSEGVSSVTPGGVRTVPIN